MIRIEDQPHALPGWDAIAGRHSFYTSADWLSFSDSDGVADAKYLAMYEGEELKAALPVHWSPEENNAHYRTPGLDAVILGGRRGYLSAPLIADPGDATALAALVEAGSTAFEGAEGNWWWPYLPGERAAVVAAVLGNADSMSLVGADCVIDVPPEGLDRHLAELPAKQRRTNMRRELQAFAESDLYVERVTLEDNTDLLGPMLSQVQQRYGHDHSPELMTRLLRRQAEHLQHRSVVFLCRRKGDDAAVGFALGYRHHSELAIRVVGFDYAAVENAGLYAQLSIYEPIQYCAEQNLTMLHLGMSSFEAKLRRGARARPLWSIASFDQPVGEQAAQGEALAAEFPSREAKQFLSDIHREESAIAAACI